MNTLLPRSRISERAAAGVSTRRATAAAAGTTRGVLRDVSVRQQASQDNRKRKSSTTQANKMQKKENSSVNCQPTKKARHNNEVPQNLGPLISVTAPPPKNSGAKGKTKVPEAKKEQRQTATRKAAVTETPPITTLPGSITNAHDTSTSYLDMSVMETAGIEDIDLEDAGETHFVPEYAHDIFVYLRSKEKEDQAPHDYLSRNMYCTEDMRGRLISWLMDVQIEFRLLTDTLFLAVSLVDRYLAKVTNVPKRRLQLVGVTAIFLACKYEETMLPSLDYFVNVAADEYTPDEILDMENEILKVLEWNMSITTAVYFLRRCSKAARSDNRVHTLCKYIVELSLPEYSMLSYVPSVIASATVYLARKMLEKEPYWTPTLAHYCGYTEEQLLPCARNLVRVLRKEAVKYARDPTTCGPATRKYSDSLLFNVAPVALTQVARSLGVGNNPGVFGGRRRAVS